ncbi:hypothetical protein DL238_01450 [Alteriqipengyuania lutimaris]|uniref:Uncharacterized protein n=1 Tax=Alteriqipengyuania lutimaris TaxID=1538146 RepID=A0A395LHP4_9SPHN|nr:hypothetical protein DL238_01450 [Alteriqipengyuania lutimaris]
MSRYPIADFAAELSPHQQDSFAIFALRAPYERVRGYAAQQTRVMAAGGAPAGAPRNWRGG